MKYEVKTPGEYISQLPDAHREPFSKLRDVILENLPDGFEETMIYGMIGYVVPHSTYPDGYHVDPSLLLVLALLISACNKTEYGTGRDQDVNRNLKTTC